MINIKHIIELVTTTTKYKVIAGAVAITVVGGGAGGGYAIYKANNPNPEQIQAQVIDKEKDITDKIEDEEEIKEEPEVEVEAEEKAEAEEEVKEEAKVEEKKQEVATNNVVEQKKTTNTTASTNNSSNNNSNNSGSTGNTTTSTTPTTPVDNSYKAFSYDFQKESWNLGYVGGNTARAGLYPNLAAKSTVPSFQSELNLIADMLSQGAKEDIVRSRVVGKIYNGMTITNMYVSSYQTKGVGDGVETPQYTQAVEQGLESNLPSGNFTAACSAFNMNGPFYFLRVIVTFS